jgi:hypothetical protein
LWYKRWICKRLILFALRRKENYEQSFSKSLESLKYRKIKCLLQEIRANMCERNHKVVYKHEEI